ncbi:MAG TPA: Fic family protein [Bryobacteraceae bacterium]|nr:Fic family protein [Bryobacteraceae bacterium]
MGTEQDPNPRLGRYVVKMHNSETVRAYVPPPLPPNPPIRMEALQLQLEQANQSLGRLDGLASVLPNLPLFIYAYVRKEAVLSSQIEGTQSSLSDLLLFENDQAPGVPLHDVQEVSNYVAAMNHGLDRLREGFPLSLRLIREIHGILLSKGRGSHKMPGELRRSQNWIGGTRPGNAVFVPPPPELVPDCMSALELFLHEKRPVLPALIKAGLVHVQFETIHPFLDGNGRLGRLLITFLLCAAGVLREPILYLSLYFKQHRPVYYDLLDRVRTHGDWETWLDFFLTGVRDTAEQAAAAARRILALFEDHRRRIETLGRPAASVLRVFEHIQRNPILSIPSAAEKIGMSAPTVAKSLEHMRRLGILREITGRRRHRLFAYDTYLAILSEGTEPIR